MIIVNGFATETELTMCNSVVGLSSLHVVIEDGFDQELATARTTIYNAENGFASSC